MKVTQSSLIKIVFIISLIKPKLQAELCQYSMSCDNNISGCLSKTATDSSDIFDIKFRTCANARTNFCNVYDSLISNTEEKEECQHYLLDKPTVAGGSCNKDQDCLYGFCVNSICQTAVEESSCTINEDCKIGTYCSTGRCRELLPEGSDCLRSTDCKFGLVCSKFRCISHLHEDGVDITNEIMNEEPPENLCESGGYYIEKENGKDKIICATLLNLETNCREDCGYRSVHDNKVIRIEDNCLCGFNKERSKHCTLGNGEKLYQDYLKIKRSFWSNTNYTKYCHTVERFNDDLCIELKRTDHSVAFRRFLQNFTNTKILALEHPRLQNSDSCIKSVIFGYNTDDVIPEVQKCPKVSCEKNLTTCFESYNPYNEDGDGIIVNLNDKVCDKDKICYIENTTYTMNLVFLHQHLKGTCKERRTKLKNLRYPGEDCDDFRYKCIEGSDCIKGKCTGKAPGEKCEKDSNCTVGHYCSKKEGVCSKQKTEGEMCETGWECANYLACYNKRCIKFCSLSQGAVVTKENAPFPGQEERRSLLCEFGVLSFDKKFCAVIDYDKSFTQTRIPDEEGFIECQRDEFCLYTDGNKTQSFHCSCGYNSEGKGYCKRYNSYGQNKWREFAIFKAEITNNLCHTLSRFNCYLTETEENWKTYRRLSRNSMEAHLYHKGVECAAAVFGSSNIIKGLNMLSLFIMILLN